MINYQKHTLPNGLTVVVNRDRSSKLAAVNLLYKIGARNENPSRTGFAHLFEHLMFRGTKAVPDFDTPVQMACGENNAFTNNDYTDFYITLPKDNIETALWLESDRMTGLDISQENLETEKRVVIEEYKQRYLNQPYGDMSMLLRALAYRVHPYRWATIGLSPDHIAGASLDEVRDFYRRFYHPSNAILSISADIPEERTIALCEKWFDPIADNPQPAASLPQEPPQTESRREEVERNVPATMIVLAYHIGSRTSPDFFLGDMTSDLLAGGESISIWSENSGCWEASMPTFPEKSIRGFSSSRPSCCPRPPSNRPKQPCCVKSKSCKRRRSTNTSWRRSRTNSKRIPCSASLT